MESFLYKTELMEELETRFALYRCNFRSVAVCVTDQLHLHCSVAEVVPDGVIVYSVLVQEMHR